MSDKKQRKSPEQSATLYKLGTKKTGLDGNTWIIAENKNKIKRWKLFKVKQTNSKPIKKSTSKVNKKSVPKKPIKKTIKKENPLETILYDKRTKKLQRYYRGKWYTVTANNLSDIKLGKEEYNKYSWPKSFNLQIVANMLQKDEKIEKIGKLDITSGHVGIGELLYHEAPIKKGMYDIYKYCGSLIMIKTGMDIADEEYKLTNISVGCDIGMFSFNDAIRLRKHLSKKDLSKNNITKVFGMRFPNIDTIIFTDKNRRIKPTVDAYYVYESDIDRNLDRRNPIAIFAGNRYGDGGFAVYKSKNGYLIHSAGLEKRLVIYGTIKDRIKNLNL